MRYFLDHFADSCTCSLYWKTILFPLRLDLSVLNLLNSEMYVVGCSRLRVIEMSGISFMH